MHDNHDMIGKMAFLYADICRNSDGKYELDMNSDPSDIVYDDGSVMDGPKYFRSLRVSSFVKWFLSIHYEVQVIIKFESPVLSRSVSFS
jgi:hypothetical protein